MICESSVLLDITINYSSFASSEVKGVKGVIAEILAARWQLVVNQLGEHLPELHEEAFARHILIGKHVEFHLIMPSDIRQQLLILGFEERGRRDGNRLMSGRKHRPAVATSLRNEQPLARLQSLHNRQIIDAASCAVREPEAGSILLLLVIQVSVLDSDKPPIGIEVRNLQPVDALLIRP